MHERNSDPNNDLTSRTPLFVAACVALEIASIGIPFGAAGLLQAQFSLWESLGIDHSFELLKLAPIPYTNALPNSSAGQVLDTMFPALKIFFGSLLLLPFSFIPMIDVGFGKSAALALFGLAGYIGGWWVHIKYVSLFSSFGGYIGVALGASLLSPNRKVHWWVLCGAFQTSVMIFGILILAGWSRGKSIDRVILSAGFLPALREMVTGPSRVMYRNFLSAEERYIRVDFIGLPLFASIASTTFISRMVAASIQELHMLILSLFLQAVVEIFLRFSLGKRDAITREILRNISSIFFGGSSRIFSTEFVTKRSINPNQKWMHATSFVVMYEMLAEYLSIGLCFCLVVFYRHNKVFAKYQVFADEEHPFTEESDPWKFLWISSLMTLVEVLTDTFCIWFERNKRNIDVIKAWRLGLPTRVKILASICGAIVSTSGIAAVTNLSEGYFVTGANGCFYNPRVGSLTFRYCRFLYNTTDGVPLGLPMAFFGPVSSWNNRNIEIDLLAPAEKELGMNLPVAGYTVYTSSFWEEVEAAGFPRENILQRLSTFKNPRPLIILHSQNPKVEDGWSILRGSLCSQEDPPVIRLINPNVSSLVAAILSLRGNQTNGTSFDLARGCLEPIPK